MRKITSTMLLCLVLLSASITKSFAQTTAQDIMPFKIMVAYQVTYGKSIPSSELAFWKAKGVIPFAQLMTAFQQNLKQDVSAHNATIDRSYEDALGRHATAGELAYWRNGSDTYTTLMKNNISWLQGNPAEYEKVIKSSYQYVLGRQPNPDEVKYWRGQGTVSYLMLVGFHEDWKRRNLSNQKESGNSVNLQSLPNISTVAVPAAILADTKSAMGISGNVLVVGAGNLLSQDGGGFIATGGW